jgi:hypothetical protein
MKLRPSQVETLRWVRNFERHFAGDWDTYEPMVWHLALADDIDIYSVRRRFARLIDAGHLRETREGQGARRYIAHRLTQLGREALEGEG